MTQRILAVAMTVMLIAGVGCQGQGQSQSTGSAGGSSRPAGAMAGQASCSRCGQMVTPTAEGRCPTCGMKVATANAGR